MTHVLARVAAAVRSVDQALDELDQIGDAGPLATVVDARLRELRIVRRRLLELREKARAESVVPR